MFHESFKYQGTFVFQSWCKRSTDFDPIAWTNMDFWINGSQWRFSCLSIPVCNFKFLSGINGVTETLRSHTIWFSIQYKFRGLFGIYHIWPWNLKSLWIEIALYVFKCAIDRQQNTFESTHFERTQHNYNRNDTLRSHLDNF